MPPLCYDEFMTYADRISIKLMDSSLFLKKIAAVFAATFVLVPLVYYKLDVPAGLYLAALLALHLIFLYAYFARVPWRRLTRHKAGFGMRILAIVFFGYLLDVLKFQGSFEWVMANMAAGLAIHTLILFSLMAEVEVGPSVH